MLASDRLVLGGIVMRMYVQRFVVLGALAAIAAATGCGSKGPSDLKITGTPVGDITGKMHVTVAFSRPMVAADVVGKPAMTPPLALSPDLPGDVTWVDVKTLTLTPKGPLPISTKFTATVPKGTKALDGNALDDDQTFEFVNERLTVNTDLLGASAHATHAPKDQRVRLVFNQLVPLDNVLAHCKFAAAGKDVALKNGPQSPSGPARDYSLVPAGDLTLDTAYAVACDTDLRGSVGNTGLAKASEEKLHTYGPLHFVKLDPSGKDIVPDESVRVAVQFTNPLKEPFLLTLTPPIPGFPQDCHALDDDAPGLSCSATLEPQTNYTLTIDAKQMDAYGQALGKAETITFHTTDAKPAVSMESGYFVAELKRPELPVWTRNIDSLQLTAVQVTQENFFELQPLLSWWDPKPADFTGTSLKAVVKPLPVTGAKNKWFQHPLGAPALFGSGVAGPGMFYLEVASKDAPIAVDDKPDGGREKVLVNFTDIGVVSKLSGSRGLVWATKLSTGTALPGATVTVRDGNGKVKFTGTTDADGIAYLPGTTQLEGPKKAPAPAPKRHEAPTDGTLDPNGEHYSEERKGATAAAARAPIDSTDLSAFRIFVSLKDDWTMVSPTRSNGLSAWGFNVSVDNDDAPTKLRGFMHTDRGLYRPGEKVHVKGLARSTKLGQPLDVPGEGKKVAVTVTGPQGKTFTSVDTRLSPFGGFWFDLDLPGDARLGDYQISAQLDAGTFTRSFTVEEYKPATFEVTGKMKQKMLVKEGTLTGTVSGNYYYGAPVRAGEVGVTVYSRTRYASFTGFDEFNFTDNRRGDGFYSESDASQQLVTEAHMTLDGKGNGELSVPLTPNDISHDADLLINANVKAQSNEVETTAFTVPYFAARLYFGIKMPSYFMDVGKPQTLQVVAVTPDGKAAKGPAKLTLLRHDWNCVWEDWGYRGNYQCKEDNKTILTKTIQLDGQKPTDVPVTLATGGEYWVVVEGENNKQEAASSASEIYAYGDGGGNWRSTDTPNVDMVADKKEYKVGDTATILLKTDLAQATGLVTIERDGVMEKRLITLTPKLKHIQIPITGADAPNVYVSVALVQGRMGEGSRGKPRMRMGIINLAVKPEDTKLNVAVEMDKKDYRPGEEVTATVTVTDQAGKPVASEVSIAAADEGVLALMGYKTPDPIPTFYAQWGLGVITATQLEYIRDIPAANTERPAFGGDAMGTVRSNFQSTAVWTPNAITDAATGTAQIKFTAPDNLTAFRVMTLAADKGHRFGSSDKRFTVSKPLQLLSSLPRFLAQGDQLSGGVVIHNETGKAGTATVKIVADNHLIVGGELTRTVTVDKDARVPVLWNLTAAQLGVAVMQFSVTMDDERDAVELKLPVEQRSPERTVRVAADVAKGPTKIAIKLPAQTLPGSAAVTVSVDPDGLAGLDDGLRALVHYPYGCLEQTTSQVIPMLAARDLAESLQIDGLAGPALDGYVKAGITKIGLHQDTYGGFSLWPGGDADPYLTAYALWGLSIAKQAGFPVDQTRVDDGLEYLRHGGLEPDQSRPHYSDFGNRGSQAFAVYVRSVWGDKSAMADATTINNDERNLPIYGKAWLARAMGIGLGKKDPAVVALVTELTALATTAGATGALIPEPQERALWAYMSSSSRTSAAVLAALVELDPKNGAIPGLVHTVMKHRHGEEYYDTQSELYSLLALTAYARTVNTKASSVDVTLGGTSILSGALTGKQRIRAVTVPITADGELVVTPTGPVTYTVLVRYRQQIGAIKAESHGITLKREYLDESGKPKKSFTVGDVVRVRVTATDVDDADHMMVSEPLPAGFEAINKRFVTQGTVADSARTEWGSFSEMYDDRVDFASEYRSSGEEVHEFIIRATSVGTFVRPPSVAQLMYQPATNAQTAPDMIEIKAK